ncbi:MAG TPA: NAD(P)-dependent alcohol dehydrogenase [Candidatus Limnocylindrales bacterium]|nr:NAD(P)-dependent alcohol dehydrogenase [Candidatus Limnocylindrales bacterium]
MKAIVQDHYGSSERLALREVRKPEIGASEVLIQVRAAGVNPADWAIMSGLPYIARPIYGMRKPKVSVRGTDVAGVVETVGSGVTRFKPGDEVFGSGHGSFADYAAGSEDELALKPTNLTFEQAAAVPMASLVALQALRKGNVRAGQKVLINGASGGIGTFAVQIAKSLGAHVTGVSSTRNMDLVRSLGADEVIDYTQHDFTQNGVLYDFILDNVSNHSLAQLRHSLTPAGTLVPNGGRFDHRWLASGGRIIYGMLLFRFGNQKLGNFLVSMKQDDLLVVKELIETGKVMPVIDRTYRLDETSQAIAHVGGGHARGGGRTRGKVAITFAQRPSPATVHVAIGGSPASA